MSSEPVLIPIYGTRDGVRGIIVAHAQVNPEDEALVSGYRWNLSHGYAQTSVDQRRDPVTGRKRSRSVFMHRLIMPDSPTVDHLNRDRLDNRRENLRAASAAQNTQNSPGRNRTGFKGVVERKAGAYVAQMGLPGRIKLRGPVRPDPAAAARDYDTMVWHHLGPDSHFNFPGEVDAGRLGEEWLTPRLGRRSGPRRGTQVSKTGFRGVTEFRGRYMAHLRVDGSTRSLGYYATPEEAARAYNAKATELFGDDAILNKVV